ncbi:uncharacterized protein LOC134541313 isoform X12 [Bacillus rossius redtenbacheri]|uniref:uncharacterized protein LOC134541313 isoform X12 n=1 Tax=Bacillus rossius redtenbacheri TaxID=93214 RepID=UPI002FDD24D6
MFNLFLCGKMGSWPCVRNQMRLNAANEDLMVKQEPSEIVFPLIKEESANKLPANGDVCMKQEPSELGFPPIKEELDEPPADGDVCVKQEPSELGFPPIKEELDEPSSGAGVTWLVVVVQCEDSWQPEPRSSSASQDYTLCKQQVKEEITIEEHPIVAAVRAEDLWRRSLPDYQPKEHDATTQVKCLFKFLPHDLPQMISIYETMTVFKLG